MSDLQIHKYKYTNTQIHKYTNTQIQLRSKLQIDLTCTIFFEKAMVQGPQKQCSRLSDVQLHKYTNKVWVEGDAPKVIKK